MKTIITLIMMLITSISLAQYPITDNFTSIGGVGEWSNQSGHAAMGVETSTHLCFSIGGNPLDDQNYEFRSPDYGTQFTDDGHTTMRISVRIELDTRANGDLVWIGYLDGGTWSYAVVPFRTAPYATYYVDVPASTNQFAILFDSYGNGNQAGDFVHIDWAEISVVSVLPIELISFDGKCVNDMVKLEWSTGSEINTDYFVVQRSYNGVDWETIGEVTGAGNTSQITQYVLDDNDISNNLYYYRLTQYDFDGKSETFKTIVIDNTKDFRNRTLVKKVNMFGQEIGDSYRGVVFYIYDDGYVFKTTKE